FEVVRLQKAARTEGCMAGGVEIDVIAQMGEQVGEPYVVIGKDVDRVVDPVLDATGGADGQPGAAVLHKNAGRADRRLEVERAGGAGEAGADASLIEDVDVGGVVQVDADVELGIQVARVRKAG